MANTTAFQTQDTLAHVALKWARELNRVMLEYSIPIEHMLEVAKARGCVGGLHIEVDCSDFSSENATLVYRDSLVVVSYTAGLGWVVVQMPHTDVGLVTDPEFVSGAKGWANALNNHMDFYKLSFLQLLEECEDGFCPVGNAIDKGACRFGDNDALLVSRNHMMVVIWSPGSGAWHVLVAP